MTLNLARSIRTLKPEKHTAQLVELQNGEMLPAGELQASPKTKVLVDTSVLITHGRGELPADVRQVFERANIFYCTVCVSEICVGIAHQNVLDPQWPERVKYWERIFSALPGTKVLSPDDQTWIDAGIIAGTLSRTQGFQAPQMKEVLNDALIYLTALKQGIPVLTENRTDFNLIQQLVKKGRFYWY